MASIHPSSSPEVSKVASATRVTYTASSSSSSTTQPRTLPNATMSSSVVARSRIAPLHSSTKYLAGSATNSTTVSSGESFPTRTTTAWGKSPSAATPPSTRASSFITQSHPPSGSTIVPKTSGIAKTHSLKSYDPDFVRSDDFLGLIAEFTPDFLSANKQYHRTTKQVLGRICYRNFLLPCGLEKKAPLTLEGQIDYRQIYTQLSEYNQMMSDVYKHRVALTQFSAYTAALNQTVPISLNIFPLYLKAPVNIFGNENAFAKKQKELAFYLNAEIPSDYVGDPVVLRQLSYFMAETMDQTEPSDSTNSPDPATSSNATAFSSVSSAEIASDPTSVSPEKLTKVLSETAKLITQMDTPEAQNTLSCELKKHITKNPEFLRHLFRYISDLILGSQNRMPSSYYRQLYSILKFFVTDYDEYLLYEDLHYVLLIHFDMVLNRIDIEGEEEILQPKLIVQLFDKIKMQKAALDQKEKKKNLQSVALHEVKYMTLPQTELPKPDLRVLKNQLDALLSEPRYRRLLQKFYAKSGQVNIIRLRMFTTNNPSGNTRFGALLKIFRQHFPDHNSLSNNQTGCCVIL